jgi:hypothetical protein
MNTLLDRACDASLKVKSTSITSDHSRLPVWGAESPEAKMWHAMKSGCSSSAFEERYLERVSTQNLIGGTSGNHTHDTSRSSDNVKSLNPLD